MNKNNIVTNSLSYLDKNHEKYEHLLKDITHISYSDITDKDMERRTIYFYNKEGKLIFNSKFEFIGQYSNNIWTWAWSIPKLSKNATYLSRKILEYGLDLSAEDDIFLKNELVTSRFIIRNKVQLDINTAIAAYITKNPLIFKFSSSQVHLEEDKKIKIDIDNTNNDVFYLFILDKEI